jgi:hypothetical protein
MSRFVAATCAAFFALAGVAVAAGGSDGSTPAPSAVSKPVTHVPSVALNAVGAGKLSPRGTFLVKKLSGARLTKSGKPEVLAADLAWCPHCAANSWALAIALSRFGTVRGLRVVDTGTYFATTLHAKPAFSHTKGLSFYRARYSSRYIAFQDRMLQSRTGKDLQKLTKAERRAIAFDSGGALPVLDVGGRYGFVNSGYSPGVLKGLDASDIAARLSQPASPVAKGADGLANLFTAAICAATDQKPAAVCASKAVVAATKRL